MLRELETLFQINFQVAGRYGPCLLRGLFRDEASVRSIVHGLLTGSAMSVVETAVAFGDQQDMSYSHCSQRLASL